MKSNPVPGLVRRPAHPLARLLLLLCAGLTAAAQAQDHPNRAHGFNPDASYLGADVDSVNLFNGHLALRVPLGIAYPVASGFDYQFQLVYNSSPWELHVRDALIGGENHSFTQALTDESSNAGLGWQLSFGRLDVGGARPHELDRFAYIAPGGSTHFFYDTLHHGDPQDAGDPGGVVLYTRDGSYLRLVRKPDGSRTLEFPDGKVHTFDSLGRLVEMADRFRSGGQPTNWVRFDYSTPNTWRITDSRNRSHTVSFVSGGPDMAGGVVSAVALAAFGGSTAHYSMVYDTTPVDRPCPHDDSGAGDGPVQGATTSIATVPLLTRINLPDGSAYAMPRADYWVNVSGLPQCRFAGSIRGLELPTGGRLEWTYQEYVFPDSSGSARHGLNRSAGVASRRMKQNGTTLGTWTYATVLNRRTGATPNPIFEEVVTTVTNPLGHVTKHYFSAYAEASNLVDPEGYRNADYGLPFTRERQDGQGRFLSVEVFAAGGTQPLRSTYVRFETDVIPPQIFDIQDVTNVNRRLQSQKTVFHTPAAGDTELFAEVSWSRFDGLGTYRRVDTSGNFESGNSRSVVNEVNSARGEYRVDPASNALVTTFTMLPAASPWILDRPEHVSVTEGGKTARTRFVHDPVTGFLASQRVVAAWSGNDGCNDVLVEYTPDGSGNVVREKYFGGDAPGLCGGAGASYEIAHGYAHGVRATSHFVNGQGGAMSFKTLDLTVDASTGLPSRRRDSAGVEVALVFDTSGRLTAERPTAGNGAWRTICYARAGASSTCQQNSPPGPNVVESTFPNGTATGPAHTVTQRVFDGFGRLVQQRRRRAAGWDVGTRSYDGAGNLATAAEIVREGAAAPLVRYLGYDPFGRPAKVVAADGSETFHFYEGEASATQITRVGTRLFGGTVIQEDVQRSQRFDRQGRLWRVVEPANPDGSDTETTYSYDALDNLVQVHMRTSAGTQLRTFDYDARGFLRFENMPERTGNRENAGHDVDYLGYDPWGNPTQVVDGSHDLRFSFDRAGRPFQIQESAATGGRVLATFGYGTGSVDGDRSNGKLATATRFNYHVVGGVPQTVAVTQTHIYGGRAGALSRRDLTAVVDGRAASFTQGWRHHDLGRVQSLDYPQCTMAPCNDPVPDSFQDVPASSPDRAAIEALYAAGVTSGCGVDPLRYCPDAVATRRDTAVLLLRAFEGRDYQPPPATGTMFTDVPANDWGAAYIEELARRQITGGCGNGAFCPDANTTNGQLAVFILRAAHGTSFQPPACTNTGFTDVPCGHPFDRWIQELARQGRTDGCGGGRFCPDATVNRAAMADVLVDGFLLLPAETPAAPRTVDFGYADGQLTSVAGYAGLTYHPNGLVAKVTNGNGLHWEQGNDPWSMRRTGSIQLSGSSTASLGDYGYDGSGNLVSAGGSRFVYDRAGRLTHGAFASGQFQQYGYDGFGNLLTVGSNASGFGRNTPTDPATNRLQGSAVYDQSGNLRAWNGAVYEYDAFQQMRRFVSGAQEWFYSYDAFGERVLAHRPPAGDRKAIDRWTLRDLDGRPLRIYEVTDGGWRIEKDYVYRDGRLRDYEAPNEGRRFFYLDHLGSPRQIANQQGTAVSGHHYFPFGEELAPLGRERMKFTGHERDLADAGSAADDLDYLHARHYNPLTARFLSPDPVAVIFPERGQSWNRYAYVENSPLNFVDPDGLARLPPEWEATADSLAVLSGLAYPYLKGGWNFSKFSIGPAAGAVRLTRVSPALAGRFGGVYLATFFIAFDATLRADRVVTHLSGDDLLLEKSLPFLGDAARVYEHWRDTPVVKGDHTVVTAFDLKGNPIGGPMEEIYPPTTRSAQEIEPLTAPNLFRFAVTQLTGANVQKFLAGKVCWEGVCLAPTK